MKLQKVFVWANIVLGTILALTPFVLFPVCQSSKIDGSNMNCFYSGIFVTVLGVSIAAFSFVKYRVISAVLSSCAGVACWLVPNGVIRIAGENWACGLCADPTHACRAVTMPAVGVLVALIVAVNVISLIVNFVRGGK